MAVAQQRRHLHRLAGAIDAALGIDESVETGWDHAAGDAAVGEIKGRRFEAQEGVIALAVAGDQQRRSQGAFTAREIGLELGVAGIVGALARKHLVGARKEPNFDRAFRLRGIERIYEGVDAVVTGERGQAEIGDDEPLGGERIELIRGHADGLCDNDVDAGGQCADGLIDGKGGGDVGVERLLDRHLAFPDRRAALLAQPIEVIAVEVALEIASYHGLEQVAVADAVDLERHRAGIDADHRNAALAGAREHIGLAGEACQRLAVTHIDVEVGRLRQRLLDQRGNAGAQRDGIALAVLEAFDAELPVFYGQRGLVLSGHADERREIGALAGQVLGELEAGARRGRVGIDRVVQQPEAVLFAQALVLLAHLGDLALLERNAQRVERRSPQRAIGIAAPDQQQALGLLAGIAGALVGDIGGGRGALEQERALAVIAGADLQHGLGETKPVRAVVGRDRHDLSEDLHAAAEVVALEGGVGIAPQRGGRLRHLAGLGLDLRFQLERGVGEIATFERFVGGEGGDGQKRNERSCAGSANEREHGGPPVPGRRGNPDGGQRQAER